MRRDASIPSQSCVFLAMCTEISRWPGASRLARGPPSRHMAMTTTITTREPGPDLVLDTLREHAASLLGTARRYSICTDDAHDAYQRAVEIFLKRAHRLESDTALPWLRTVVKHEALAVRAARQRLPGVEVDLDARHAREVATPEERATDADALTRSAEALQRLKPQEVHALLLKAEGHSYKEIGALTGWSYTNVNPAARGTGVVASVLYVMAEAEASVALARRA